ncbi:hypothetical protein PoB_001150000 [Plakobranchus ocellatus]|uniref:Uncharacterized protein n=1 Tax=Plakobranchus ocellatus TaxID=259542 RepID=A0AAV3YPC7_9GAST|nr:hypothetical protein PoB_001150000 [Plakobranchus ocellatus]
MLDVYSVLQHRPMSLIKGISVHTMSLSHITGYAVCKRRVAADFRADSLSTVPPTRPVSNSIHSLNRYVHVMMPVTSDIVTLVRMSAGSQWNSGRGR